MSSVASEDTRDEASPVNLSIPAFKTLFYNTGHGDFCFGRWTLRERLEGLWARSGTDEITNPLSIDEEMLAGSHNVLFEEIGDFKRSGPFLWYKLPSEIRLRVLRFVLEPFHSSTRYDNDGPNSYLDIDIRVQDDMGLSLCDFGFEGDFAAHKARISQDLPTTGTIVYGDLSKGMSAHDDMTESEYLEGQRVVIHYLQAHPYRSCPYRMSIFPAKKSKDNNPTLWDWKLTKFIRQLSHVSRQFRVELGEVLWARTRLWFTDNWNYGSIQQFLEERPAILGGIKAIEMELALSNFLGDGEDTSPEGNRVKLLANLKHISHSLILEKFVLGLLLDEIELSKLANGTGQFSFLAEGLKNINTKEFIYTTIICELWPHRAFNSDREERNYVARLEKQFSPRVRQFLLPDCLRYRDSTNLTQYLHSRLLDDVYDPRGSHDCDEEGMRYLCEEGEESEDEAEKEGEDSEDEADDGGDEDHGNGEDGEHENGE